MDEWAAFAKARLAEGCGADPEDLRVILDLCLQVISDDEGHEYYSDGWSGLTVARRTVRNLAAAWSGHPDYPGRDGEERS